MPKDLQQEIETKIKNTRDRNQVKRPTLEIRITKFAKNSGFPIKSGYNPSSSGMVEISNKVPITEI